jgi:hypothetical protein
MKKNLNPLILKEKKIEKKQTQPLTFGVGMLILDI